MQHGKLENITYEIARVNVNILSISEMRRPGAF